MHGNIREWCHDSYGPYAEETNTEGIVNPDQETTVDDKNGRVLRGGSFLDSSWKVRSSSRDHFSPRYCEATTGFRLARTISPALPAPKHGNAEHTVK
jgi:formylglycine-generating enzyme required for sulfatase activity